MPGERANAIRGDLQTPSMESLARTIVRTTNIKAMTDESTPIAQTQTTPPKADLHISRYSAGV